MTAGRVTSALRRVRRHTDHALADVIAGEDADERSRSGLEPFDDILEHLELVDRDPGGQLLLRLRPLADEI